MPCRVAGTRSVNCWKRWLKCPWSWGSNSLPHSRSTPTRLLLKVWPLTRHLFDLLFLFEQIPWIAWRANQRMETHQVVHHSLLSVSFSQRVFWEKTSFTYLTSYTHCFPEVRDKWMLSLIGLKEIENTSSEKVLGRKMRLRQDLPNLVQLPLEERKFQA